MTEPDIPGPQIPARPFLNTAQAAHYLGISARSLRRLRTRGSGPIYRRHLRAVVYVVDDLNAWSAARREEKRA